ncbi:ABC transporter substrate-binding protein, partial [Paracidovorax avenae]
MNRWCRVIPFLQRLGAAALLAWSAGAPGPALAQVPTKPAAATAVVPDAPADGV